MPDTIQSQDSLPRARTAPAPPPSAQPWCKNGCSTLAWITPMSWTSGRWPRSSIALTTAFLRPRHRRGVRRQQASPFGEHFIDWLKLGVQSRNLIVKNAKALVHTVAEPSTSSIPAHSSAMLRGIRKSRRSPSRRISLTGSGCSDILRGCACIGSRPAAWTIRTCEVTGPRKSRRPHDYHLENPGSLFLPARARSSKPRTISSAGVTPSG